MTNLKSIIMLLLGAMIIWTAPAYADQELIVSAAASLTNALKEVAGQFEKTHPGTKIVCNFAASGSLLQQIAQGAPVDVFASADQKTMNQAQEKGLIVPASRKNFVSNTLVLIAPEKSSLPLAGLRDLASPEVKRVALGNPETVPVGRYTQEALTKAGLWETLKPKFIYGESVRQVLDYVSRGEVDAGFVFATDAAIAQGKVKIVTEAQGHQPIIYPAALVAASQKKPLAQSFLDFILSPAAQEIFKKYGFGPGLACSALSSAVARPVEIMKILVDIKKRLWSGRRVFRLEVAFASDKDFVVLFGPSGAGKSLTLQAIAGLITPDEGRIVVGERTIFDSSRKIRVPSRYRNVGYVFQDYALFPHLTVAHNVAFGLKTRLALVPAAGRTAAPGGGAGDF